MQRSKTYKTIILSLVISIFTSTLIQAEEEDKTVLPKDFKFKQIKDYDAELECVSPKREFKAGSKVKMTFRLRNYAMKSLVIYEWYEKEAYNIRLYYIPWSPGMKIPPKDKWNSVIPTVEKDARRMTMELRHRSSALIDVELPFIEKLKTDHVQYFYIFTELNLTSISVRSKFIKIMVKP